MSLKVSIICDLSGSMVEGGKRFITRTIVRAIEQYFRLGFGEEAQLRLVAWSSQVQTADWPEKADIPAALLECTGSADHEQLVAELGCPQDEFFIIVTDGYWSKNTRDGLKQWRDQLRPGALVVIKTGSDANPLLKGKGVYSSESVFDALGQVRAGVRNG